jgi:glycosyltransferase involved in cell wall biosynthesis
VKRIVMVGSARDVRGGVSAMVNVCFEHGLFERWEAVYLPTHCDGAKARKAWRACASLARFAAQLLTGRVALLHVHIASGASFWRKTAFVALARLFGVPYILHVHAGDFRGYYERSAAATRSLLRWVYSGARTVVALAPSWRSALESVARGARVEVIPNPVAIPPWMPQAASAAPRVLFLGVLRPEKGLYELLAAWPAVTRAVPGARLTLAGSGEIERARALAAHLGISGSVDFPGWVGPGERARLMEESAALVLPSHFEALPMAVLEAMAAGLPIVATRVGGIPDAVGPEAGLLVEPRDVEGLARALVAALTDPTRRIAMGATARLRASTVHSADVVVPAIERLWASAAPCAKRTSPCVALSP